MNARYAFLAFGLLALTAHAQFINVTNSEGDVVNGQLVTVSGQADAALLSKNLLATLNGSTTVNVNMRRYELSAQPGTQNYFCWGVCYDAVPAGLLPAWSAGQEGLLTMEPGVTLNNFSAYHQPMGFAGISTYRFVWYNAASATDTVYVDIRFDVAAVGIEEIAQRPARIDAAPNPAIGQDVQLDLSLDRAGLATQVIIHDMLGATIKRYTVSSQQSRLVLPTTEWTPGVYFVSLERNGALLATKRVVVAR